MLTHPAPQSRHLGPRRSLRQEYEQFIVERVEGFKEQISREELLAIADEAVRELEVGPEGQLVLTEVLVLEHVDRLIIRRLRLPSYRRWRERHLRVRLAQREPTHWGLEPGTPLMDLARRLEDGDVALVVGTEAAPAALFLAAHEVSVVLIDDELAGVEAVENQAAAEALGSYIHAMVVTLGEWFPDVEPALVVLDPGALGELEAGRRMSLVDALRDRTARGGVHCILPAEPHPGIVSLTPDALQTHYAGWLIDRGARPTRGRGFTAIKP